MADQSLDQLTAATDPATVDNIPVDVGGTLRRMSRANFLGTSATAVWGGTAGGTANALTLTPSPAIGSYSAGQRFQGIIATTNTGAATANVSGLGIKTIKRGTEDLVGGEMVTGTVAEFVYDGTYLQLVSSEDAASLAREREYNVLSYIAQQSGGMDAVYLILAYDAAQNSTTVTAGINAAITAAIAAGTDFDLVFPAGLYNPNGVIDLSGVGGVSYQVRGMGMAATEIKINSSFTGDYLFNCDHGRGNNRGNFFGFTVTGSGAHGDPIGLYHPQPQNGTWRDLYFNEVRNTAIYCKEQDNNQSHNIIVRDCGGDRPQKATASNTYAVTSSSSDIIIASSTSGSTTRIPGYFSGMVGAEIGILNHDGGQLGRYTILATSGTGLTGDGSDCKVDRNAYETGNTRQMSFAPITCAMTSGNDYFTADFDVFDSDDVGKFVCIDGAGAHADSNATAGAAQLFAQITDVDGVTITVDQTCQNSVTGARVNLAPAVYIGFPQDERDEQNDKTNDVTFSDWQMEDNLGCAMVLNSVVNATFARPKFHGWNAQTPEVYLHHGDVIFDTCYRNVLLDAPQFANMYSENPVRIVGGGAGIEIRDANANAQGTLRNLVLYDPADSDENYLRITVTNNRARTDGNLPLVAYGSGVQRQRVAAAGSIGHLEGGFTSTTANYVDPPHKIAAFYSGAFENTNGNIADNTVHTIEGLPGNNFIMQIISDRTGLCGRVKVSTQFTNEIALLDSYATELEVATVAKTASAVSTSDVTSGKVGVLLTTDDKICIVPNTIGANRNFRWACQGGWFGEA